MSSVAFSADGKTLATGSGDKTALLWDLATGEAAQVLEVPAHDQSTARPSMEPKTCCACAIA